MCVCCGTSPRHSVSRRLARGGSLVCSPKAKGSAPPEHRHCNIRSQGLPEQVLKHDVRKAGRQPLPVPSGQHTIASFGATAKARDGSAHPKQQPRQAQPGPCRCGPIRRARAKTFPPTQTRPHVRPSQTSLGRSRQKPAPRPPCLMCVPSKETI